MDYQARSTDAPLVVASKPQPSSCVLFFRKLNDMIIQGSYCGEVSGPFTIRQCINFHKLLVLPIYLSILRWLGGDLTLTQEWGPAAGVLLICHSTYGFLWVYKDIFFPDKSWQRPMNFVGFLVIFTYPLGFYYTPMLCLVTDHCVIGPLGRFGAGNEPWLIALGLWFYIVGMFYHFGADLQKEVQLTIQQPRQLITTAMFAHSRNPNYFGEIMIYLGYATLSMNWLPFVGFILIWLQIFVPNMLSKEASMSRHTQWGSWKARTGFVLPWLPTLLKDFICNALARQPVVHDV